MSLAALSVVALLLSAETVPASPPPAVFALIVGVNRSVDADLAPLSYADDDAARYRELFQSVGAHVVLLTRPDENTRRVAAAALSGARAPERRELDLAVADLQREVQRARGLHRRTILYFVFAGHGNLSERGAYLSLEDDRLTGAELDRAVLRPIGADQSHLIVDACYSYFLAHERGASGRAREVRGFATLGNTLAREDVGLLLSTSSSRESHEWEGFQAGVFSHEVRSGLYGAADADGDNEISYREIAAFVRRANAAISNERFRPEVFARPPAGSTRLLALAAPAGRLTIDRAVEAGHYLIEDSDGNRLLDFHNVPGHEVQLVRPLHGGTLFVRQVATGREYEAAPGPGDLLVSTLVPRAAQVRARGAAHHAFSLIFSLPFDAGALEEVQVEPPLPALAARPGWRSRMALAAGATAVLAGVVTTWAVVSSRQLEREATTASQVQAVVLNQRLEGRRLVAVAGGLGAAAAGMGAALLWLWPSRPLEPSLVVTSRGDALLGAAGRF